MYRTYNPQPQPQPTPNLKRPDNGSRRPPPSDAISMISMAIGSRLPNHQRRIACGHSGPLVYLIGRLKVNYNLFNFINIYCRVISGVARHRQSPNEIIVASRTIARGRSMQKPTKNIGSHQNNLADGQKTKSVTVDRIISDLRPLAISAALIK